MALIFIENYKSQTIEYNDETDKFVCDMVLADETKTTNRKALKDVRKEIDSFTKLNMNFKPFKVLGSRYGSGSFELQEVRSIRSDGSFAISSIGSSRFDIVFPKDLKRYSAYDDALYKAYELLEQEEEVFRKQIRERRQKLIDQLKPADFSMYAQS